MFEAMAGAVMATKIHFSQMKYPFVKKKDRVVAEEIYKNEVNKLEEEEKYEKSRLPESGYMTVEEYEAKSRAKSQKDLIEETYEVIDRVLIESEYPCIGEATYSLYELCGVYYIEM